MKNFLQRHGIGPHEIEEIASIAIPLIMTLLIVLFCYLATR